MEAINLSPTAVFGPFVELLRLFRGCRKRERSVTYQIEVTARNNP